MKLKMNRTLYRNGKVKKGKERNGMERKGKERKNTILR